MSSGRINNISSLRKIFHHHQNLGWRKYGLLNAFIAFLIGLYTYTIPIMGEFYFFFIYAPVAAFVTFGLLSKKYLGNFAEQPLRKIIKVGLVGTVITHYLTLVIRGSTNIVWYTLMGESLDTIEAPDGFLFLLFWSLPGALISFLYFGAISILFAIVIGYQMKRYDNLRKL